MNYCVGFDAQGCSLLIGFNSAYFHEASRGSPTSCEGCAFSFTLVCKIKTERLGSELYGLVRLTLFRQVENQWHHRNRLLCSLHFLLWLLGFLWLCLRSFFTFLGLCLHGFLWLRFRSLFVLDRFSHRGVSSLGSCHILHDVLAAFLGFLSFVFHGFFEIH